MDPAHAFDAVTYRVGLYIGLAFMLSHRLLVDHRLLVAYLAR